MTPTYIASRSNAKDLEGNVVEIVSPASPALADGNRPFHS